MLKILLGIMYLHITLSYGSRDREIWLQNQYEHFVTRRVWLGCRYIPLTNLHFWFLALQFS